MRAISARILTLLGIVVLPSLPLVLTGSRVLGQGDETKTAIEELQNQLKIVQQNSDQQKVQLQTLSTENALLHQQLDNQEKFQNTIINRLNWEFNVLSAFYVVIGIVLTLLGYATIQNLAIRAIEKRLTKIVDEQIVKTIVEDRAVALLDKWDKKFAEQFQVYTQLNQKTGRS